MRLFAGVENFRPDPAHPLVLGLGNFDGLHRGHKALLRYVTRSANRQRARSAVITFREHPQQVLHPGASSGLLTSLPHKLFLLEKSGIDLCFLMPFTRDFSKIEPREFVKKILVERLQIREISLGASSRFGHDRRGDNRLMQELAQEFGFRFQSMEGVQVGDEMVSSSRIRKLIEAGNLSEAQACLGHRFSIFAKVVKGQGRGRVIGYPTANLDSTGLVMPPEGVYAVTVREVAVKPKIFNSKGVQEFHAEPKRPGHRGVLNYGRRPTFPSAVKNPVAEVFLFGSPGDLYGKILEVAFHIRLRPEKIFKEPDALRRQIEWDVARAKAFFKNSDTR